MTGTKKGHVPYGNTSLYKRWCAMKQRCLNPNDKNYKNYGGRGIVICKGWEKHFTLFRAWAENGGYKKSLTLDRIDNNGPYSPENCRWTNRQVQNVNKRQRERIITVNGETGNYKYWAEKLGCSTERIKERVWKWGPERAVTQPLKKWTSQKGI